MSELIIPVILAGGQGTRLWPSSLPELPKQFIKMGGTSLMTRALKRALELGKDEVLVITSNIYVPHFQLIRHEIESEHIDLNRLTIIGETEAKNTAPAIAYAVRYIQEKYENAIALVITADHLIEPTTQFIYDVHKMIESRNTKNSYGGQGLIVSFGIKPTHPETGYGYIECGEYISDSVRRVLSFKEKPQRSTAEEYITHENYYWNSGMFCFPVELMAKELAYLAPQLFETIIDNARARWIETSDGHFSTLYLSGFDIDALEAISIDFAIMEKSANIGMVQASFTWNDVGSWDEAIDLLHNNTSHYFEDAKNCSVYSPIPVGIAGVQDINVIVDNDRVLIVKKASGQLVSALAKKDRTSKDTRKK